MLKLTLLSASFLGLASSVVGAPAATSTNSTASDYSALPIVDLGYNIQQATSYNSTGNYYAFENIRYAAPPTGNLRFRQPQAPGVNRRTIQNGSVPRICPQALPSWIELAYGWIDNYVEGKPTGFNRSAVTALNNSATWANVPAPGAGQTEDCLFLDVLAPKKIFKQSSGKLAPVIVWIYGGGYVAGSKGDNPGLIERSKNVDGEGVIYVTFNYRLGALGWLAGPTLESDGVANAALYDQRFALQWVQKNIHLFGGDKNRVTVLGESAGAGSIMHQITAYGGKHGAAPFQQAIMQSAAWQQETSHYYQEEQYLSLLAIANATSLDQLRGLTTEQLQAANYLSVWRSPYGTFQYGPAVDGTFVPDLPGKLLLQGAYTKDLNVMVGHNSDEGLLFVDPSIQSNKAYKAYLASFFTSATEDVIEYIADVLYPPIFDGTYPWTDWVSRTATTIAEGQGFACNSVYLDHAYGNRTYAYLFSVPPGLHGEDVAYTFYNGGAASATVLNTTTAFVLQDWIASFAIDGVPAAPGVKGVPKFNMYGSHATVEDLGEASISLIVDPASNNRCDWWQLALYE